MNSTDIKVKVIVDQLIELAKVLQIMQNEILTLRQDVARIKEVLKPRVIQ
jgi:hypothetical protein